MTLHPYTPDPTPGVFDHRSGDCKTHGVNIPFFRPKGYVGQFECCECALEYAIVLAQRESVK